jgi:hypothetical protein
LFRDLHSRFNTTFRDEDDLVAFLRRHNPNVGRDERTVTAYVNRGRWVADCPNCNGGCIADPSLPSTGCVDCGYLYPVEFPGQDDQDAAADALASRKRIDQNWHVHVGETPDDLRRENVFALGLPVIERAQAIEDAGLIVPDDLQASVNWLKGVQQDEAK